MSERTEKKIRRRVRQESDDTIRTLSRNPKFWKDILFKNPLFYYDIIRAKPRYIPSFLWGWMLKKVINTGD